MRRQTTNRRVRPSVFDAMGNSPPALRGGLGRGRSGKSWPRAAPRVPGKKRSAGRSARCSTGAVREKVLVSPRRRRDHRSRTALAKSHIDPWYTAIWLPATRQAVARFRRSGRPAASCSAPSWAARPQLQPLHVLVELQQTWPGARPQSSASAHHRIGQRARSHLRLRPEERWRAPCSMCSRRVAVHRAVGG